MNKKNVKIGGFFDNNKLNTKNEKIY